MRVGNHEFRPGLASSLIVLVVFVLLLGLGFWQLDRAEQKRRLLEDYRDQTDATAVRLRPGMEVDSGVRFRQAWARGRYDAQRQFLLDNKIKDGRVGYEVITPLYLAHSDAAVLVNRGWVPMGRTRADLPAIPAPEERLTVNGRIRLPPEDVFSLGEGAARRPGWPKVIPWIQPEVHAQQLDTRLLPVVLLLGPEEPHGFERDWTPVREFGPERHVGYAVQWFALAVVLIILFVWATSRRLDARETDNHS